MAPNHLFGHRLDDLIDLKCAAIGGDLGMQDNLKQDVAKLLGHLRIGLLLDRFNHLV